MSITLIMNDLPQHWVTKAQFSTKPNWASKTMVVFPVYFSLTLSYNGWPALPLSGALSGQALRLPNVAPLAQACPAAADAAVGRAKGPLVQRGLPSGCEAGGLFRCFLSKPSVSLAADSSPYTGEPFRCGGITHRHSLFYSTGLARGCLLYNRNGRYRKDTGR